MAELLEIEGLEGGYGRKRVLYGVSMRAEPGEVVGIVGHNGAGKTTLLKTIFGMLPSHGGSVMYEGVDLCGQGCRKIVRRGVAFIPSEEFVFADLTVIDNLHLAAPPELGAKEWRERLEEIYELFPILSERNDQLAGTLSGGQQRMLSLAMAMQRDPRLLLLDEPSLGLAPALAERLFEHVRTLADQSGQAVLLVEQNLRRAFAICDRVYVMRAGQVIGESAAEELRARDSYWDLF
ncbi:MAG TPA: ABC transporter ATP-binding protein [Solirubrobacterales bacterium]